MLLALERRRIVHPKAQDYADFQNEITAGICDRRNGGQRSFCAAAISKAHVRSGSKRDMRTRSSDV